MAEIKKKVLIVEDEKPLREILKDKFKVSGFLTFGAKDGKEGLSIALKEHPDIILLDIIMPIMDGMTVLKKLREDPKGKNIPVILLTNLADDQKVAEATEEGVYGYLVKSDWKIADVVKMVEERLGS